MESRKVDIEIKNAIIENVKLSFEDRGVLDCWVTLDYGGTGQGFGGYSLYLPKSFRHHNVDSVAGHHLYRIMEVSGVTDFSSMKGKAVRVAAENGLIKGMGHITKDDWYYPSKEWSKGE